MQIQPASIEQITKGRNGMRVRISSDVGNIAKDLANIDPDLELHANETGGYYEVRCKHPVSGKSYLVTTALDLDQRIVDSIRKMRDPQYDFIKESDQIEKAAKKELEHQRKEKVGEAGEKLAHSMRKDLHIQKNF